VKNVYKQQSLQQNFGTNTAHDRQFLFEKEEKGRAERKPHTKNLFNEKENRFFSVSLLEKLIHCGKNRQRKVFKLQFVSVTYKVHSYFLLHPAGASEIQMIVTL
jgi:hypothetical protein